MATYRNQLIALVAIVIAVGVGYWQRAPLQDFWQQTVMRKWHALVPATPAPRFQGPAVPVSHVPPPSRTGEKLYAAPGSFYMVERVKVVSRIGIQAVNPGERVMLLERLPNGKLRVTIDHADFTVTQKQVTDDLDVAREAERRFQEQPPANL
jgi:hypothetical protein